MDKEPSAEEILQARIAHLKIVKKKWILAFKIIMMVGALAIILPAWYVLGNTMEVLMSEYEARLEPVSIGYYIFVVVWSVVCTVLGVKIMYGFKP